MNTGQPGRLAALLRSIAGTFIFTMMLAGCLAGLAGKARAIEIQQVRSKSGVTAWLVEDHSVPLIAMKFSFAGGAGLDPAGKTGLANFMSMMLDEGAGNLQSQAFQQELADLSIRLSFSANRDRFTGSLQTLTVNSKRAFELLALALKSPRFDGEPIERMRRQITISIRQDNQKPRVIASRAMMKQLIGDHPYARPLEGTEKTVASITAGDLSGLAKRLLVRRGLKIAVTGDIDAATLKTVLDTTFGGLPEKSGPGSVPVAKINTSGVLKVIQRDIPQSVIQFGQRGILYSDKDYIAAYILNTILGSSGFGSRLMDEVREKRGLAYSAYSYLYTLEKAGFLFGGTATVNARAGETIAIVRDVFTRMARQGPTQKELDEAKAYLTGAYALRFDTNAKIASQLHGILVTDFGIDYVKTRNDKIRAVTLKDIKRVARRILKPDELVFVVVGKPQGLKAGN